MLQDYARNLKDVVPTVGLTLARVAQILRGMRGFTDTADTYGPSKAGRIASFLKLYPKLFYFLSRVLDQASGCSLRHSWRREARAVQVGGASSSGGPAAARQPRAIEVDHRAPYRRFPNEQRVRFGDNRAGPGGPSGDDSKVTRRRRRLEGRDAWEQRARISF